MVSRNSKSPLAMKTDAKNHRRFNGKIIIPGSPWGSQAKPAPGVDARVWTAVEPFASGEVYVNHLDAEGGTRIRAAYSDKFGRLVALKNKHDPTNPFRLNQNIKPTNHASGYDL
jgi:hypothetical protein